MKLTTAICTLIAGVGTLVSAKPNDGDFVTDCYKLHKNHPQMDDGAFNTTLSTWMKQFGSGGGELVHGLGGDPVYQAVCCKEWCLYVKLHSFDDISWTDSAFDAAVERLRRRYSTYRHTKGHCHTTMTVEKPYLEMGFISTPDTIWFSTGHERGQTNAKAHPMDVWGDTCGGDPGFIQGTLHSGSGRIWVYPDHDKEDGY